MRSLLEHKMYTIKTWVFASLFLFPLFSFKLVHSIFMVYSVLVLVLFFKEKTSITLRRGLTYLLFTLPFIPYLIEWIIYPHNRVIQFETEKKILFFIAPFIFCLDAHLKGKNQTSLAITGFISALSVLSVTSLIYIFGQPDFSVAENKFKHAFQLRQTFEEFSGLHPSYYGLFSTMSSLWILTVFHKHKNTVKIILTFCLISLVLLDLLLASKMSLLILVSGGVLLLFRKKEGKLKAALVSGMVLLSAVFCIFFIPSLNARFSEFTSFFDHQSLDNTLVERNIIFNCNRSLAMENLLTGLGSRNSQAMLDYCYSWCGFNKGALIHLNSHNQFFTLLLNYGIFELLLFLGILVFYILKTRHSVMALLFWISVCLMMMSESILERQMGVYYFLFFAALFYSMKTNNQQEPILFENPFKV